MNKKVFVSGCFDVLHGGHIEFFTQAKTYGDHLTVCIASDKSLLLHKNKKPSIPILHRIKLISSLKMVDDVVVSTGDIKGLDFEPEITKLMPDILISTEDDVYVGQKILLCERLNIIYERLPKTLNYNQISTSDILSFIRAPEEIPLRIDFAGGWLDVPKHSINGGSIVNCTISPLVSLHNWKYHQGSGLGGSAAYAILTGKNSYQSELNLGVGWQDPAVINETGLCAWNSGPRPSLAFKRDPYILTDKIALFWTGKDHYSPGFTNNERNYKHIYGAGKLAYNAVLKNNFIDLCKSVNISYRIQLLEGMEKLPDTIEIAKKYCGGGFGGYALYMFKCKEDRDKFLKMQDTILIQPYICLKNNI